MKPFFAIIACVAALASDRYSLAAEVLKGEQMVTMSAIGKIAELNLENRELTLLNPAGSTSTFVVDRKIKHLDDFKVGDQIKANYLVAMAAEVREAMAAEKIAPYVILSERMTAPPDTAAATEGLRLIRALCTVEGLDRPAKSVTVKGPRGNFFTARVKDAGIVEKLRIGQTIVLTCTEGLITKIEKEKKPKAP
jgi:hypothetical protein